MPNTVDLKETTLKCYDYSIIHLLYKDRNELLQDITKRLSLSIPRGVVENNLYPKRLICKIGFDLALHPDIWPCRKTKESVVDISGKFVVYVMKI